MPQFLFDTDHLMLHQHKGLSTNNFVAEVARLPLCCPRVQRKSGNFRYDLGTNSWTAPFVRHTRLLSRHRSNCHFACVRTQLKRGCQSPSASCRYSFWAWAD